MQNTINSALNSIQFLNMLSQYKRASFGDYVIEVTKKITTDDAMIIKNILLLLNQAHQLNNITAPVYVGTYFKIYSRKWADAHDKLNDDSVDALAYAMGYKQGTDTSLVQKVMKKAEEKAKKIEIKDIKLNEDTKNIVAEFMNLEEKTDEPVKNDSTYIPEDFKDNLHLTIQELMKKYGKSKSTIGRWKRKIKDESSKQV